MVCVLLSPIIDYLVISKVYLLYPRPDNLAFSPWVDCCNGPSYLSLSSWLSSLSNFGSNMEVAGLVLGGIHLAMNLLQEYRSFLSSLRDAQRDLNSIIRRLRTQQHILENTYNILLIGIAPPSKIETIIHRPSKFPWNKYEKHVRLRLGQDWDIFQDTTRDMQNTVQSMQSKLGVDDNGKVSTRNENSASSRCLVLCCMFRSRIQRISLIHAW